MKNLTLLSIMLVAAASYTVSAYNLAPTETVGETTGSWIDAVVKTAKHAVRKVKHAIHGSTSETTEEAVETIVANAKDSVEHAVSEATC